MHEPVERVLIIEAGKSEKRYWSDLFAYRELLFFLCWRDILVRYKQTVIGVAWSLLRPIVTMVAFTIVFSKLAKLPSEGGAPYSLMVLTAMLPWQFFASALGGAAESLVASTNLVSKVYFPRLLVPMSNLVVHVVDFFISLALMLGLMIWHQYLPSWQIVAVIPLTVLTGLVALGPGLLFCAMNVTFRDVRYLIPFITQFGLYISPVGFSSGVVPEAWRLVYELNPMVGVIDAFRWAVLGSMTFPVRAFCISCVFAVLFMILGIAVFRNTEKTFADVI